MTKRVFTKKEQERLRCNPNIKAVSEKGITYSEEFKRHFIVEYEKGKLPGEIFDEVGLDIKLIGKSRIKSASRRWRAAYHNEGINGLQDARKGNSSRANRELTLEEKIVRLEAKNQLLTAENELLKKLDLLERQALKKK